MFSKQFFPTPHSVMDRMGIHCQDAIVLEPSAGKGDMVDWLISHGARNVIVCEKNEDLATIVANKAVFLKHDFLKVKASEVSHINTIVMNPPFNADEKHILHAWEIAPDGCEIIALCNWETIHNRYNSYRNQLSTLIKEYGNCENLGNCFSVAERKTQVEIGCIHLFKPRSGSNEFDGFFMDGDEPESQGNGIMPFNAVRDVVQRYINAVKLFEEHEKLAKQMNELVSPFGLGTFSFEVDYDNTVTTKEDFKKAVQKKAWHYLFDKMNLKKYVTSGVMKDINAFVEKQSNVPFTMKNIYRMFEIIVGTRDQIFDRALVEAVDNFTRHTHDNRHYVEGWKTNEGHLLNSKIIVPYMVESGWKKGEMRLKSSNNSDHVEDLTKVLCSLTGKNYDDMISLHYFMAHRYKPYAGEKFVQSFVDSDSGLRDLTEMKESMYKSGKENHVEDSPIMFGKWYDWGFFKIKGFKKGTLHMKFRDEDTWAILNRRYAHIRGAVLPEKMKPAKNKPKTTNV